MLSDNAYHHRDAQQRQPADVHTAPLEKVTLGIKILKTHSHSHSQIADNPENITTSCTSTSKQLCKRQLQTRLCGLVSTRHTAWAEITNIAMLKKVYQENNMVHGQQGEGDHYQQQCSTHMIEPTSITILALASIMKLATSHLLTLVCGSNRCTIEFSKSSASAPVTL